MLTQSDELREVYFLESTKGCIMQMLGFGDADVVWLAGKGPKILVGYDVVLQFYIQVCTVNSLALL